LGIKVDPGKRMLAFGLLNENSLTLAPVS